MKADSELELFVIGVFVVVMLCFAMMSISSCFKDYDDWF